MYVLMIVADATVLGLKEGLQGIRLLERRQVHVPASMWIPGSSSDVKIGSARTLYHLRFDSHFGSDSRPSCHRNPANCKPDDFIKRNTKVEHWVPVHDKVTLLH